MDRKSVVFGAATGGIGAIVGSVVTALAFWSSSHAPEQSQLPPPPLPVETTISKPAPAPNSIAPKTYEHSICQVTAEDTNEVIAEAVAIGGGKSPTIRLEMRQAFNASGSVRKEPLGEYRSLYNVLADADAACEKYMNETFGSDMKFDPDAFIDVATASQA